MQLWETMVTRACSLSLALMSPLGARATCLAATATERGLFSAALSEFSEGDRQRLERGDRLARVIDTDDNLEIIVLGVVRVSASRERALQVFRDVRGLRSPDALRQYGSVSRPARPEDFARFIVDPDDARDLGRCRSGKCEVRLPEDSSSAAPVVAEKGKEAGPSEEFMKRLLLTRARQYETQGDAGLPIYVDRPRSVHVAEVLAKLGRLPAWVDKQLPEVRAHLDAYPAAPSAEVDDFVYWSVEKRYRAPVVALTHGALFPRACSGNCVVLATKQTYASHYFEASLELMVFVPYDGRSYLVYLNRSRADNPRPQFHWYERALLELMVKRMIRTDLARVAGRLNSATPAEARREDSPAAARE
jgi:hypothetical protein